LTLLGQFTTERHIAADAPDCAFGCAPAEMPSGGFPRSVSAGVPWLRYPEGYDRGLLLTLGQPVRSPVAMRHIGHAFAAGSRLRLLIGLPAFPIFDPNPDTGAAIADTTEMRTAAETIFHDAVRASHLKLPVPGR
jgi:predicted acyl esterase